MSPPGESEWSTARGDAGAGAAAVVLERVRRLPALPAVVTRVLRLMQDGRSGAADYELVLRTDPGLTLDLLRLANSAAFGLSREVLTVRQAVTLVGTRRLFDLLVGASLAAVLPPTLPGYGIDARTFWRHCVAVATLAEGLAARLGGAPPDLLFTAGLLHDAGKLVVSALLEPAQDALDRRLYDEGLTLEAAERELLRLDHAGVGERVVALWNLPPTIAAAVRWHHEPDDGPADAQQPVVDIVHVADGLAHLLGLGADMAGLARRGSPRALARLGLTSAVLESVAGDALDTIEALTGAVAPATGGEP